MKASLAKASKPSDDKIAGAWDALSTAPLDDPLLQNRDKEIPMQHPAYKAWPIVLLFFGLSFQAAAIDHCKPSKWGADDEIGAANIC